MKKIIILLLFTLFVYGETLSAQEFSMKTLRIGERKLLLNEFKKLHEKRENFKQELYQKTKHRRSKKIKKDTILTIHRESNVDKTSVNIHTMVIKTNSNHSYSTLHNMIDSDMKVDYTVDMMNPHIQEETHANNEIESDTIVSQPDSDNPSEDNYQVDNSEKNEVNTKVKKSISPWARKR